MRLFVAVELPEEVREHLDARISPLRESLPGWRWTPAPQWHLTLAFLGEVADDLVAEVTRRMGLAARRHQPFDAELAGLGAFTNARRARVLWAGVGGDRQSLVRLAESVSAGARRAKVEVDDRRYRPHMTLGRRRAPVDLRDLVSLGDAYTGPSWTVEEFVLVRSHLGSAVRHEILESFPLRPQG